MVSLSDCDQTGQPAPPKLVAVTWYEQTCGLIQNPNHPCVHADLGLGDLADGQKASAHGHIFFFEGTLEEFEKSEAFYQLKT